MADGSPSTPKVHVAVPEGYADLPEEERLAEAAKLAAAIRARLRPASASPTTR